MQFCVLILKIRAGFYIFLSIKKTLLRYGVRDFEFRLHFLLIENWFRVEVGSWIDRVAGCLSLEI